METTAAAELAEELMGYHGNGVLDNWTFKFDRAKRRFGQCSYRTRTISLSAPLVTLNSEERVRNTILHEIAHALVGPGHGHDYVWREMARAIGCDGRRCCDSESIAVPPHVWTGTCPSCFKTTGRHRITDKARRVACARCCNAYAGGRYDARFVYVWERQSVMA